MAWLILLTLVGTGIGLVITLVRSNRRRCPHCAERIRFEARTCPYCQKDVTIRMEGL